LGLVAVVWTTGRRHANLLGVGLATVSGALTSGLGYAIWYAALEGLSATRAAIVQLTARILAAAGGVIFLGEEMTLRLALSAAVILGGVALALTGHGSAAAHQLGRTR
jgi:drug/metabolite transporter (DMT)-like permease